MCITNELREAILKLSDDSLERAKYEKLQSDYEMIIPNDSEETLSDSVIASLSSNAISTISLISPKSLKALL